MATEAHALTNIRAQERSARALQITDVVERSKNAEARFRWKLAVAVLTGASVIALIGVYAGQAH